jgi:hypothetical protein
MNFLNPFALGAMGLAGLVAAVYFLKKRPQPYEVSALFLWPEATSKSRSAWRWYKAPISLLLLQLLILIMLVVGLGQPVVNIQAQGAGRIALVMDTSASMQMQTENGSRMDQALSRAQRFVDEHQNAEITLIEAQKLGGVVVPLSGDIALVKESLSSLQPTFYGDVELSDVVQWVQSQGAWDTFDRVIWMSDHLPEDAAWQDYGIEFDLISDGFGNAAISAFSVRPQPETSLGYEAFIRVDNFSNQPLNTNLRLYSFNETLLNISVDIDANGAKQWAFPMSLSIPRQLSVSLDNEDGLAYDNERHFSFLAKTRPNVFWVGESDRFLEQLFLILGVDTISPWTAESVVTATDLIVVNQATLPALTEGNVLLIHSAWQGVLDTLTDVEIEQNRATDLLHPVLQRTSPENIVISHVAPAILPKDFSVLLEGATTDGEILPLLGVFEQNDMRLAWLGFSLNDSNLRLTVDFPILVSNLLKWLVRLPLESAVLETGDTIFFNESIGNLMLPNQQTITLNADAYTRTQMPGFYATEDRAQAWAINVPLAESATLPETVLSASLQQATISGLEQTVEQPVWMYLALFGLIVLGIEWLSYERGWL